MWAPRTAVGGQNAVLLQRPLRRPALLLLRHTRHCSVCVCVCVCVCACARARVGGWVGGWAGVLVRMGRRRKRMIAMRFSCACMRVCAVRPCAQGHYVRVHGKHVEHVGCGVRTCTSGGECSCTQKQPKTCASSLPARTRNRLAACRQGPDTDTDTDPHRGGGRAQAAGGPARRSWPASRPSLGVRHRHDGFLGS